MRAWRAYGWKLQLLPSAHPKPLPQGQRVQLLLVRRMGSCEEKVLSVWLGEGWQEQNGRLVDGTI